MIVLANMELMVLYNGRENLKILKTKSGHHSEISGKGNKTGV